MSSQDPNRLLSEALSKLCPYCGDPVSSRPDANVVINSAGERTHSRCTEEDARILTAIFGSPTAISRRRVAADTLGAATGHVISTEAVEGTFRSRWVCSCGQRGPVMVAGKSECREAARQHLRDAYVTGSELQA